MYKCFAAWAFAGASKISAAYNKKDLTEKWNGVTLRLPQMYACLTAGPSLSVKE
jgi:hypothetical protein